MTPAKNTAPAAPVPAAATDFERALEQLEALVARLESGELPLDQALATFEQGVRLTRECQTALAAAQQKVQILLQQDGNAALEDFDPASGGGAANERP